MYTAGQMHLQVHIHLATPLEEVVLVQRKAQAITDLGNTDDFALAG